MGHIVVYIQKLMIFISFGLPMPCGAVGEFAVNIAYGKPAIQSSIYIGIEEFHDTPGYPYDASLAVDANKNTSFKGGGCSHTNLASNSAWWEVDLLDLYKVLSITIYQRTDGNRNWLNGFVTKGKVSNNTYVIINNPNYSMPGTITIPVETNLKFNGIRIELNKAHNEVASICLCEVEVLADVDECRYGNNVCKNNGHCINNQGSFSCRCYEGFTGNKCETVIPCNIPDIDSKKGIYELHPVLAGNVSYTSYLTIKCKEGYRLIGSDIIRCTSTGEWDTSIGQCTVILCSGPFIIPNNSVHLYEEGIEGNLTYNSTISIRCQEGYKVSGTDLIRCNGFGVWDRQFGICRVIDCGWPEDVPLDVPLLLMPGIASGFSYNATVCIQRNEGLKKDGDMYESLRCSSEGSWRGSLKKCFETTNKEAYTDQDGKKFVLPIAVFVPICLILIVTNIITLLKYRRYACYRGQPSEQIEAQMTIADHFASSKIGITKREQNTLSRRHGGIELQRRKRGSEETHSHGTGPYDELQKDHRENSEYDELKFKRDLTSNKGIIYQNTDDFAQI